jgi:hypothetical protein
MTNGTGALGHSFLFFCNLREECSPCWKVFGSLAVIEFGRHFALHIGKHQVDRGTQRYLEINHCEALTLLHV